MARIVRADFKLITEEQLYELLKERPELAGHHLVGFCSLTQTQLVFGPGAKEENRCLSCLPDSHFVLVPVELLPEKEEVDEVKLPASVAAIHALCQEGKWAKTA